MPISGTAYHSRWYSTPWTATSLLLLMNAIVHIWHNFGALRELLLSLELIGLILLMVCIRAYHHISTWAWAYRWSIEHGLSLLNWLLRLIVGWGFQNLSVLVLLREELLHEAHISGGLLMGFNRLLGVSIAATMTRFLVLVHEQTHELRIVHQLLVSVLTAWLSIMEALTLNRYRVTTQWRLPSWS